jgi:hypothetical protein
MTCFHYVVHSIPRLPMRKLPSSASAGNLRQLVDSSANVIYSSNESSMMLPSATLSRSSSDVSLSMMATEVGIATMDPSKPPTPSEGEDRGCKKSRAYRHTKFHSMLKDEVGKAYERRMCSHCDAVFSFKGGTTSAALRHLKTAHRELLAGNPMATTREPHSGQAGLQVPGHDDHSADLGAQAGAMLASPSSVDVDVETRSAGGNTADAVLDSRSGLQRHNSARSVASSVTSEDGYIPRPTLKRKRGSSSDEEDDGDHSADTRDSERSGRSRRGSSSKLTASQEAIVHFLSHYLEELPLAAMRLRFAKHLTHDVAEAEMYNVLDPATQLEYVREFAQPPGR